MQERLKELITGLGVAEKDVVEKNFLEKLQLWARLIDEVEAGLPFISDIHNANSNFDQTKQQYEQILNNISGLNIAQDASRVSQIQSYYSNFRQYFNQLIDLKLKIQAVTEDKTDIHALRKVVAQAKKQAEEIESQTANFEKSFKESLGKQASGSQRVLATHFKKRLDSLKENTATSPDTWLVKRNQWFWSLLIALTLLVATFVTLLIKYPDVVREFGIQIAIVKAAIIALFYLQYHFASKNYHIYADLVAKYEHLSVISETMTDFTAAAFDNDELNAVVYTNAARTLFSEVNTGHLKRAAQEPSVIENFVNQIPKAGQ